jgi:hypothetical protein
LTLAVPLNFEEKMTRRRARVSRLALFEGLEDLHINMQRSYHKAFMDLKIAQIWT